ncbi:hypothetical protein DAPPUDRAFT_108529 [Daphnia pulex]|uniref:Uncharacterized protein n=1 Tax=Daphnia pulex TaxID=6669 RepID=E9H0F8_DAPPU|nr:hypothetical protein DAPPUDRAFT_108529 [Daphnia pulex]|eukprot:EFX74798.1 hypothetical protein DAPPUDRAFT_108529 [Daphnia pulex]
MAESVVPALTSIAEEEEVVFDDTITDPARLKRFRTTAKMIHTNAGKKLMQSVKVGEAWRSITTATFSATLLTARKTISTEKGIGSRPSSTTTKQSWLSVTTIWLKLIPNHPPRFREPHHGIPASPHGIPASPHVKLEFTKLNERRGKPS